jgi:hypothetical protein
MRCLQIYCQNNLKESCNIPHLVVINKYGECNNYISIYTCDECGCELTNKNNKSCLNFCDNCVDRVRL